VNIKTWGTSAKNDLHQAAAALVGHRKKVFLKNRVQVAFSGDNTFTFNCLRWRDTHVTRMRHEDPVNPRKSLI
jgi:hypothetical protein